MQLFAFTLEKEIVAASSAFKKREYFCMECGKPLRLRGGEHRQNHFYHLKPDPGCRQSQKSLSHLQLQKYLYHLFPEGNAQLERRFPAISRIADVVWEERKLVFEVQCSPIAQQEVEARNRDYASLGYQVVWILHERRFARWRASAAEQWLTDFPHYYTDFDSQGRGVIYDQLHLFKKGLRCYSSAKTRVNLALPIVEGGRLTFEGDWRQRVALRDSAAVEVWEEWESERKRGGYFKRVNLWHEVKRWYLNVLYLILEGCSRQDREPR